MPAYGVMLQMCRQLIEETIGKRGRVLILGAGGGLELEHFARRAPDWEFSAVDPDAGMLGSARERAKRCGALDRTTFIEGYIQDAPPDRCDAATCLLTLHFVADDGAKFETLQAVRARLKPGAPFLLVDLCIGKNASDYEVRLARYRQFALDSGAPRDQADSTGKRLRDVLQLVSPERDLALLAEAGFADVDLFYAGHSWRGWVAYA